MEQQTYRFTWQGIKIEAIYTLLRWRVSDHLEIRSMEPRNAPLPITNTGYLSHFMQPGTIQGHGGDVMGQVIAWLDEEAANPDWLAHIEGGRQGDLF